MADSAERIMRQLRSAERVLRQALRVETEAPPWKPIYLGYQYGDGDDWADPVELLTDSLAQVRSQLDRLQVELRKSRA
jgi:hypothetical protein